MNQVNLVGRLTADPQSGESNNGVKYAKFTLAVSRPFTKRSDNIADFFDVVAFRGQADLIEKNLGKGRLVRVTGYLASRVLEDPESGRHRKFWNVVCNEIEFLDRPKRDEGDSLPDSEIPTDDDLPDYDSGQEPKVPW